MIYLLFGTQKVIIDRHLKKILSENYEIQDEFNVIRFSMNQTPLAEIIYEATLLPLGYERKAIIVENANFLTSSKDSSLSEEEEKSLLDYFAQPNEATDLFFIIDSSTLNEKGKILQTIKANEHKIFEAKDISKEDWPRYVEKYFERKGASITKSANDELVKRIQADAMLFMQEANKLVLYKNHIDIEDVEILVSKPLEENIFAIADSLIKNKKMIAIKIYRDLLGENSEPVRLISLMASQFRLLSQVEHLRRKGRLSNINIAKELGVNDYRVMLACQNLQLISYEKIIKTLDELAELDYKIKSGEIDRFYGFEMFLVNY